ncbi:uncharacterized protein V6R79_007592 [Siganus canaliculatus]
MPTSEVRAASPLHLHTDQNSLIQLHHSSEQRLSQKLERVSSGPERRGFLLPRTLRQISPSGPHQQQKFTSLKEEVLVQEAEKDGSTSRECTGKQTSKNQTSKNQTSDKQTSKNQTSKNQTSKNQTSDKQTSKNQTSKNQTGKNQTGKNKTSENQTSENQYSKNQTSKNKTGKNQTSKNQTGKNQTGKNKTSKNQTSDKQTSKNQTSKNQTGKNQTGKNQTGKNQTSKNQTSKNQTGKNQTSKNQTSKNQTTAAAAAAAEGDTGVREQRRRHVKQSCSSDRRQRLHQDSDMKKLQLLFLLLLVLCVRGSLQQKGSRKKDVNNSSVDIGPFLRTFVGDPDPGPGPDSAPAPATEANLPPRSNGTQGPISRQSLPALWSLSNGTMGYLDSALSTRVIPITYMLAFLVGVPANVVILCTLATKIRKVSSAILYCSLAVSDLLLLLSLLFKAHYHLHGNHWALGEAACRVVTACFYGNLYCSAQTLSCISIKRYLAVAHPFMYKSLPKRTCTAWVTVGVWGVFGAAVVPELLVQQSYWLPQAGRITCHDVLPLRHHSHAFLLYYNVLLTGVGLLLPLLVTVWCYVRIIRELNRSHHDWGMYIKASSLVFAIFLLCFTPAGLLHFVHHVQLSVHGAESLYVHFKVAVCLCCLHACVDPFLFILMSKSAGSRLYFTPFKGKTLSISF